MTEKEAERLEKIRAKMAQIKAQEQAILAKDKKRQRKERTRRLIQIGTIAENFFGKGITPTEFEKFLSESKWEV